MKIFFALLAASAAPITALYMWTGFQIADELSLQGVEYENMEAYFYIVSTWPRVVAVNAAMSDDTRAAMLEIQRQIDRCNRRPNKGY